MTKLLKQALGLVCVSILLYSVCSGAMEQPVVSEQQEAIVAAHQELQNDEQLQVLPLQEQQDVVEDEGNVIELARVSNEEWETIQLGWMKTNYEKHLEDNKEHVEYQVTSRVTRELEFNTLLQAIGSSLYGVLYTKKELCKKDILVAVRNVFFYFGSFLRSPSLASVVQLMSAFDCCDQRLSEAGVSDAFSVIQSLMKDFIANTEKHRESVGSFTNPIVYARVANVIHAIIENDDSKLTDEDLENQAVRDLKVLVRALRNTEKEWGIIKSNLMYAYKGGTQGYKNWDAYAKQCRQLK